MTQWKIRGKRALFALMLPLLALATIVLYIVAIVIARPLSVVFYPVLWVFMGRPLKETVWLVGITVYDKPSDSMIEYARKKFKNL